MSIQVTAGTGFLTTEGIGNPTLSGTTSLGVVLSGVVGSGAIVLDGESVSGFQFFQGATVSTGLGPTISPLPNVLYCTDEDIYLWSGPDYWQIIPTSPRLAYGTDGSFSSGNLWTLTSASENFYGQLPPIWTQANTSNPTVVGYMVKLTKPASRFPAGGSLFGVAAITGVGITLRQPGMSVGQGRAPSPPGGLDSVEFEVLTFYGQIVNETVYVNKRFQIDPSLVMHSATNLSDIRPLNRACLFNVLINRYTDESRQRVGDYRLKLEQITQLRDEYYDQIQLIWQTGLGTVRQENWFGTRIIR